MPGSLTKAGRRWVEIADRHPERNSTPILKLSVFAQKIEADERKLDRLVREATRDGYDTAKIAATAKITVKRVAVILNAEPSADNRPREMRVNAGTAIGDLERLAKPLRLRHDRREWWVERAAKEGWDVADIADAAQLSEGEVERIAAGELEKRRLEVERLCSFCGKPKDSVSGYCKFTADHQTAHYANRDPRKRAEIGFSQGERA